MTRGSAGSHVSFRLATPAGPGAIAVVELVGDVGGVFTALSLDPVEPGRVGLRSIGGVDRGVVARWDETRALLMPHGGPQVMRELSARLIEAGAAEQRSPDPCDAYPEAVDRVEALMLGALAEAQSPAAVDLLLDQPGRWRGWTGADPSLAEIRRVSVILNRLITAPIVVAVGPPNVGKSTLTNALARRAVSVVADEPGTTRDHVGVTLELPSPAGLVAVRWVDAPGFRGAGDDPIEREAGQLVRGVIGSADLIVQCGDAASGFDIPTDLGIGSDTGILRAGLRADLGYAEGAEVDVAALHGEGVDTLAARVREALLPDDALSWSGPWLFDARLMDGGAG